MVNEANDVHQLRPMVEKAEGNLSKVEVSPKVVLGDAGYCSEENLEYMESLEGIQGLIATGKESEMEGRDRGSSRRKRRVSRRREMDRKLRRPVNRFIYGFRKQMIEPVFGQLKRCQGLGGFLLRGLEKVKAEFSLWCSAHNILKLYRNSTKGAVI